MLFANNCNTTLSSSLTNVATTMSVTSASAFPSPTGSQYFYCTLADAATQTTIEIVKVTAVSGTTFTIVRGQDGTTGTAFSADAVVSLRLVRANLNDFPKLDEDNTFTGSNAYGTPASITLTNGTNLPIINGTTGTLSVARGGTGLTSLTAGYIPYGNGTSAFNSGTGLTFDGTNLKLGTSNGGVIFSNASALTNSTLNDYETGTWTPNQGSGLTVVGTFSSSGKYTKIGNQVTVVGILTGSTSILVAQYGTLLTNLPFSNNNSLQSIGTLVNSYQASTSPFYTSTAAPTNLNSMMATTATPSIWFSITYTANF